MAKYQLSLSTIKADRKHAVQEILTPESFAYGLSVLQQSDRHFCEIIKVLGFPPFWVREPGFVTLIQIILEQQVSFVAAQAVFARLQAKMPIITPEKFLELNETEIKQIGFSRQKIIYTRFLAESIITGLDLDSLATMDDEDVRSILKKLKGIGDWTVDIYLLTALRRPDSLPKGDLAVAIALQKIKKLEYKPSPQEIELIAEVWRPWRGVATRLLWHYYLNGKRLLISNN
jgi:DNA-3-methyladenine glycosylase II